MATVIQASTWRRLYEGVGALLEMAPWDWMFDTDLFAVEHPQTKQIGYCCITGSTQKFFGLSVYRGEAGLYSYEELQAVNVDHPLLPPATTFEQDCLSLTFRERDEISSAQLASMHGMNIGWDEDRLFPLFEDLSPGHAPWPIESESDADFLITCLEQSREVARMCKDDPDLLDHVEEGTSRILIRRMNRKGVWQNSWQTLRIGLPLVPELKVNQLFLRSNCLAFPIKEGRTWMADVFYFPTPLQDEESQRPYYPVMTFLADQSSGIILGYSLHRSLEELTELQGTLVNTIRKEGYRPERILVPNLRVMRLWEPFSHPINLKVGLSPSKDLFSDFKLMLFGSMSL